MIIKKISCKVTEEQKNLFYESRKQWEPLGKVSGFLGQIGGWSEQDPLTASIYAFWENHAAYQFFMDELHDAIFLKSDQKSTYTSIDVQLYEKEHHINGSDSDFNQFLRGSNFIRVSLSAVKNQKINHFKEMQGNDWNLGMKESNGMLGGTFARSKQQHHDYLVLSGWRSQKDHDNYITKELPQLLKKSWPEDYLLTLTSEHFKVEEAWRVV